jgi:predicted nuclease of predicted toxin-antitoxin system
MRFLVDESAGTAIVQFLRSRGFDVVSVAEAMPQADDEVILAQAMVEARIIVTNDKDFGRLVFQNKHDHAGAILLRLRDERVANRVQVLQAVLIACGEQLSNCFVVAGEGRMRVHRRAT